MTTFFNETKGRLIRPIEWVDANGFEAILIRPGEARCERKSKKDHESYTETYHLEIDPDSIDRWTRMPVDFICRDRNPESVKPVISKTCGAVISPELTEEGIKGILIVDDLKVYEKLFIAYKAEKEVVVAPSYHGLLEATEGIGHDFKVIVSDYYSVSLMIPGEEIDDAVRKEVGSKIAVRSLVQS